MPNQSLTLTHVLQALADPTRRAVVERLARGPLAMTELHKPFAMALPSFAQHLDVLERCGIVRSVKEGRVRTYQLAPKPYEKVEQWISRQRDLWEERLDRLEAYAVQLEEKKP